MNYKEIDIFDLLYETFKIDKNRPLRLFEAFSGMGTQHMSLKQLGNEFGFDVELVGTSDWWITANIAYNAIHTKGTIVNNEDTVFNREQVIDKLLSMGFSSNDKEPATRQWYERKSDKWLKKFLRVLDENKSYGAIGTFDKLPKGIDIATWSFPCQDISQAGTQQGMVEGTKSNYGYQFLDLVDRSGGGYRPKVLLMENVRALFSKKFKDDWREIQIRLEKMGYKNYAGILNARNYGVAQNRERVFIVSILGDYNYTFPKGFKLEKKLKDYLEDNVNNSYFLSKKMYRTLSGVDYNNPNFDRTKVFKPYKENERDYAFAITTRAGDRPSDNFIIVPEATKQGYKKGYEGDGVYIDRPHQKRGTVQRGIIQTIKTQANDIGVIVSKNSFETENYFQIEEIGGIDNARRVWKPEKIAPTITSVSSNQKIVENEKQRVVKDVVEKDLRIRKLTEREAFRLMGVSDEDFDKVKKVVSSTSLYKLAGNAIVVDVLYYIFKQMI